jgi:branched-chain amino acid transport system substrate-binding protein
MKKLWLIMALVVIVVPVLTACGGGDKYECKDEWGCATIEKGQKIKIAYVGPITGDYADFGIDMSRGAEMAVKAHPEVEGFEIELLAEDTQGTPEQGASVANKLAADSQVVAVDGHSFSGSTEVAIPIYGAAHIVMLAPSATNPDLTKMGSEVFNRVAFHDEMQSEFAAKYIYNTLGIKKIAVMHDGGAYGATLADMVAEFFKGLGGEVVGAEAVTPGETDYSAPLAAIAAKGPEMIYYGGYSAEAAVLATQMVAAGLEGVGFFGCDGTYGANYLDLGGEATEGTYSTFVPIPESDAFATFRADYQATYGDEQGKLSTFSPHSYDSATILINAIEAVAKKDGDNLIIPRKALADEVRGTKGYTGLTGEINCSSTGECAAASIRFMIVENGDWVEGPGQ